MADESGSGDVVLGAKQHLRRSIPPHVQEMSGVEDGDGQPSIVISSLTLVVSVVSLALGLWSMMQYLLLLMKVGDCCCTHAACCYFLVCPTLRLWDGVVLTMGL